MATKSQSKTKKAERNNDQLFLLYSKNFSTGSAMEFAISAEKLANWLKVDKAYYPKARPTIVHLLETAHDTVRRHSGFENLPFHISRMNDGVRPYAEPFVRLVRTVIPFYLLFLELPLQMRLRVLFQTICNDVDELLSQQMPARHNSTTLSIATTRTTPLSPPVQSPVAAQASFVQAPVTQPASVLPSLSQSPNLPASRAPDRPLHFMSNSSSLTIKLPGRPNTHSEDIPPSATLSTIPQARQVASPAAYPSPTTTSPAADVMASQSTRPKTKKRKVIAFDAFIEADLEWYKDSVQAQETPLATPTSPLPSMSAVVTPATGVLDVPVVEPTPEKPPPEPILAVSERAKAGGTSEAGPSTATLDTQAAPGARTLSEPLRELVPRKSRSPSVPLQTAVKSPLKRKAPDDEADVKPTQVASTLHSPPKSPDILSPSIARRRMPRTVPLAPAPDPQPGATETKPNPSKLATGQVLPSDEALPSPLPVKKKKKKRKGPPGLKVLPILPLAEDQPGEDVENILVESTPVGTRVEGRESQSKSKSRSQTPPPQPVFPPESSIPSSAPPQDRNGASAPPVGSGTERAIAPEGAEQTQESGHSSDAVLGETTAFVASPDAMEVDTALRASPNGVSEELAPSKVPERAKITQEEDIPMGEPYQVENVPLGEDIHMQETPPSPDVPPTETSLKPTELNGTAAPNGEVLNTTEINGMSLDRDEDKNATKAVAARAPSLALDGLLATTFAEPEEEPMDPRSSPFESNAIRLLSLERGHPSHTSPQEPVELHFTLADEEAVQVARWNSRDKSAGDLSKSMCVSLISYPLEQCATAFERDPDAEQGELDVVGFGRPRPWPRDGSVYVVLDVSGDHGPPRTINVAPPFGFNTIHKPVDLGERGVYPGDNTLHLFQFRDHSDRIFAVVLHHPTAAQLAELQAARDHERFLEAWIEDLGTFDLTQPRLAATPVANVVSDS